MHFCVSTVCNTKCRNLFLPFASLQCFCFQPNLSSKRLWPLCLLVLCWDMRINARTSTLTCKVLARGLGLIWGNLRELHFEHIEHVTSDFWRSMYSCSFLGWGRQHGVAHGVWPNEFLHFSDWIRERHVLLFYVLCSQNTVNTVISLFWGINISALKFAKWTRIYESSRHIPGAQTTGGKYFYTFGSWLDWYASTFLTDCKGHIPTSDASPQSAMDSMLLQAIWNTLISRVFWPILRVKLIFSYFFQLVMKRCGCWKRQGRHARRFDKTVEERCVDENHHYVFHAFKLSSLCIRSPSGQACTHESFYLQSHTHASMTFSSGYRSLSARVKHKLETGVLYLALNPSLKLTSPTACLCISMKDLLMCLYFITLAAKQRHCLSVFRSLKTQWKEWWQHVTKDIVQVLVQAVHLAPPFYSQKNKWRVPDFYDLNTHEKTSLLQMLLSSCLSWRLCCQDHRLALRCRGITGELLGWSRFPLQTD